MPNTMVIPFQLNYIAIKANVVNWLLVTTLPLQGLLSYENLSWYVTPKRLGHVFKNVILLSGEPDYFGRNKISSGGDLSHYSSASLY